MILKYNEFIKNRSKERNQIDEICQDDDLQVYHWDANTINPRLFDSIFRIEEISDSTLKRMTGNSYPADEFIYLFKELFINKFPIERMELIDNFGGDDIKSMESNNTSAFNYRVISGKDKLSKHAFGMAIDINPLYNPCVRDESVNPESGEYYANRNRLNKYTLIKGDLVYKILHDKFGFSWGGDFEKCKDYQHYEK